MKQRKLPLFFVLISFIILTSMSSSEQWKLYKSIDGVNIYTKIESHTFNKVVTNYRVFKYENTNKTGVELSWKLNVWYNGVCRACDLPSPNEYEMKLSLKAGEIQTGKADSDSKIFAIFSSSEGIAPLDKFEFENLSATLNK